MALGVLCAAAACRTGGLQVAPGPATATPAQESHAPATGTPREASPSDGPANCGPRGTPLVTGEIPQVDHVAAEDVPKILALIRQRTRMPVSTVRRDNVKGNTIVDAMVGCCFSAMPDGCTIFHARLDQKEGQWTILSFSQVVE